MSENSKIRRESNEQILHHIRDTHCFKHYWNSVHGHYAEDVVRDLEGMQVMRTLGRNMTFMIKSIELGKKEFGLPEKEERVFTNFIR